jgi:hypothetical protein
LNLSLLQQIRASLAQVVDLAPLKNNVQKVGNGL